MKSITKRIISKLISLGKAAFKSTSERQEPPHHAPLDKNSFWMTSQAASAYSRAVDFSDSYETYLVHRYCSTVEHYVPKQKAIMDIGSGTGILTRELAKRGYKLTAVDISAEMQEYSIAQTPSARHIVANVFDLPSDLQDFDAIASRWFIPHFKNWDGIIEILGSRLKPGGYLFFDMPNQEHIKLFPEFHRRISKEVYGYDFGAGSGSDPFYYSSASHEMLVAIAEKAGCDLITTVNHGFFKANMAIAYIFGNKLYKEFCTALANGFIESKDAIIVDNYENLFKSLPRSCAHHSLVVMKKSANSP